MMEIVDRFHRATVSLTNLQGASHLVLQLQEEFIADTGPVRDHRTGAVQDFMLTETPAVLQSGPEIFGQKAPATP